MGKIDDLIKNKCPNGVKFLDLEKCCNILDNKRKPVTKSARTTGEYPYYGANGIQDYVADYIFDGKYVLVGEDGSVINENGNPIVTWAEGKIWVNNHAHIIEEIEGVSLRYLYHYIQTINVTSLIHGNIPKLNQGDFRKLQIAVPPLEVQCEIVHILDDFTLLSAELSAELKARQKQYEYYRDKLLTFEEAESLHGYFYRQEIKWLKLKEICKSIKDGMHNLPKNTLDKSMYPILSAQNIFNGEINFDAKRYVDEETYIKENKRTNIEKGDVLLTIVATIGRIAVVKEKNKFLLQRSVCVLKPNELINPYYLKFYLETNKIQNYMITNAHGSAQSGLYLNQVAEIIVPIPSMDIQNKIVTILTNFYKITHDISEGLPAEIEARKKQYEYYRDKLLTFKELKVNE